MMTVSAVAWLLACISALSLLPSAINAETLSGHQPPGSVLALIKAVDQAEPISKEWLSDQLMGQLTCTSDDSVFEGKTIHFFNCDAYKVKIGNEVIDHVDFHGNAESSLLIISGLKSECLPIGKLVASNDPQNNECTDGFICRYAQKKRPWGTMSVAVPTQRTEPQCATSIVFDKSASN